jgi:ribosomal protein L37AE/L43A
MASVERRISDLEAATGGADGCERCGDTIVVRLGGGEVYSVSKRGHQLPHAAAVAFVAEEGPHRICPVCSTHRVERIRAGWAKGFR